MENKEDLFYIENGCQIFPLQGRYRTLSTSSLNGGIRTDLKMLLNINCLGGNYECEMNEDTYEKELDRQVRACSVDPKYATALSTAAWTELFADLEDSFRDLKVRAVVTGGIDHNATAPGDPAGYYEENGKFFLFNEFKSRESTVPEEPTLKPGTRPVPGTLNIFLFINKDLTEAALLRALMVCAEAKEAAVRELLLGSCYSSSLASGSGTDGCVIASQMDTGCVLTDASGHSKLGELIGKVVKDAVRQALLKQTGANGARQFHALQRVKRLGITPGSLYDFYKEHETAYHALGVSFSDAGALYEQLQKRDHNSNFVLVTSLYVHLFDQYQWGLIMQGEMLREGKRLLQEMLYTGNGMFLKDVYDENALHMNTALDISREEPITLLMHYMLLWLGK